ncbi:MAG: hypothetical protein IKI93_08230 [Clostridia bacterium]|nr:hypothetical protein [Clostridia bacterium]MBR3998315.1 hypothetical protein [Clostridia bacterium]
MKNTDMSVSRAAEMYRESEYAVAVTDFLSPGEKAEIYHELVARIGNGISRCFFWGGCRGAERCAAVFLPEWYLPESAPVHKMVADTERVDAFAAFLETNEDLRDQIPIRALKIRGSGFKNLTHRDFMGGILSLGIDRSVIGDIAVTSESEALVMVHGKIAPFLLTELKKIGRDAVKVEEWDIAPTFEIPRQYADEPIVVSSPRLDGVVKALTGKSRELAAEMVRSGLVELEYKQTDNVSAEVREGMILSIRGFGKYVIGHTSGTTKSGRIRISCKKYI